MNDLNRMAGLLAGGILAICASVARDVQAAEAPSSDADQAWEQVERSAKPPPPPAEWGDKPPTEEQREAFRKFLGEQAVLAAGRAREFYTRFPDHPKASLAREKEKDLLQVARQYGSKVAVAQSDPNDPALSEDEKLEQAMSEVQKRAIAKRPEGAKAVLAEFETGMRALTRQYPGRPEPWQQLFGVASYADKDTGKRILKEIVASPGPDEMTLQRAKGMLKAMDALGQPLELSFSATDGRTVDVQKFKGKVVLIDFWASWCGPCMMMLPDVVRLYNKHHPNGLEIIGINMDKDRRSMESVLRSHKVPWPQYFDGQGWGNKFAIEYAVSGIPSMWLVDKRGILRSMEVPEDNTFVSSLEEKIQKLLSENVAQ